MRIALAAFAASSLFSLTALAAGQSTPAQLPPPPAPPPGKAQPAAKPKAQPAPASATPPTTAATPATPVGTDNPGPAEAGALDTRWALGAMVGFSTDYLNFGLGVRGGKTFGSGIYIGGSALFHFAGDTYSAYAGPIGNYTSSASVFYFGPEGGYDFDLKAVVLRAYLGLGLAYFNWSVNGGGTTASGSMTRFVVWPGASVLYDFAGSPFFLGGDIRFVSVPGGPAVGFFAFGGVHFGS